MEIYLMGVRGSIPSPSQTTQFYGANTPSTELRTKAGDLLIFDAGSGLRMLGDSLPDKGECHFFITHRHSDHTTGLGFFKPFFKPGWTIHLYLPEGQENILECYFDGTVFPMLWAELPATIKITIVRDGQTLTIEGLDDPIRVDCFATRHPGGNMAYKVFSEDVCFLYTGDHEITQDPAVREFTRTMLRGANMALVDATFNRSDLIPGWGHSTWEDWVDLAEECGVTCLALSHHAPDRSDEELDKLQKHLLTETHGVLSICVAREGMRFGLGPDVLPDLITSNWLQEFIDKIGQYKEESVILDAILSKTREVSFADAGTVYLLSDGELFFAYSHNDSHFPPTESSKYAYSSIRLPCTTKSIAGYAAVTGKTLNLPDIHKLPKGVPYSFNDSFDKATGYRTHSTLTIPLIGKDQRVLGVLQLINSLNPRTEKIQPFNANMEKTVMVLLMEASKVLEVSSAITDNIYRLQHIASLHDPTETGPHAERVGAIAAEVYQAWARAHNIPANEALNFRGQLRLAAMLHDIGKVGISDSVLKKPGKLTKDEFEMIKSHTGMGAKLFEAQHQDISELAHDIALHHHQKWDGTGYGQPEMPPLKEEEIPLAARITALADVFDALVSPRCYKEPWKFEDAISLLKSEAGKHFDPELVGYFVDMMDTVALIYARFPEPKAKPKPPPPIKCPG